MARHIRLPHLSMQLPEAQEFKSPQSAPRKRIIPERDRALHAAHLKGQLSLLEQQIAQINELREGEGQDTAASVLVTVKGKEKHSLKTDQLASKKDGVEVVNIGVTEAGEEYAVIALPKGDASLLRKKVDTYESEDVEREGRPPKPKLNDLVASMEEIHVALIQELWVGPPDKLPPIDNTPHWWEVWLLGDAEETGFSEQQFAEFSRLARELGIDFDPNNRLIFPERQVLLVQASGNALVEALRRSDALIVELRPPSKALRDWVVIDGRGDERIMEFPDRIVAPPDHAASIVLIDTGVADGHPLVAPAVAEGGLHNMDPRSDTTGDDEGHGTQMAGVALYEDLSDHLIASEPYELPALLESVKVPIDRDEEYRHLWGSITQGAVETAEGNPGIDNRVFCLAIGAENPNGGKPGTWSYAVDQLCYESNGRLFVVAAGNVEEETIDRDGYPARNLARQLDEPAQARNAICVGGITDFVQPSRQIDGTVIAPQGCLSPCSSTHLERNDAIKPDIVCEAGNALWIDDGFSPFANWGEEGVSILTTSHQFMPEPGRRQEFLTTTFGTSPAAAGAARMLAQIWKDNPERWEESIRGLLIHSARWTPEMRAQFANNKADLLRAFGYGLPDVASACASTRSAVTLFAEDSLRIAYREKVLGKRNKPINGPPKRDFILVPLPWPEERLVELGETEIELRVTLSYFAEPNPKNTLKRYEGAGLKWDLQLEGEADEAFTQRINKLARDEDYIPPSGSGEWEIGIQARSRGTVQSDRWHGTAAALAARKHLAVFSTFGWWKDFPSRHYSAQIPFSLLVSVITPDTTVDLYTDIAIELGLTVENLVDNEISIDDL